MQLDASDYIVAGVFAGWVHGPVGSLNFERAVKRFRERIIETGINATNRLPDVELGGCVGEGMTEILRASIGVENRSRLQAVVAGGHAQRIDDQIGAHMVGDRVTNTFFGAAVNDSGQVGKSLPGRQIRDIGAPRAQKARSVMR